MKKKVVLLLTCAVFSCILAGCCTCTETVSKDIRPQMEPIYNKFGGVPCDDYYYTVDENTGVVYIEVDGFRRHGITVAYNADGTIMKKEDLGRLENES